MKLRISLCVALVGFAGSVPIADDAEIRLRVRDETIAPGGVVQMKVERYEGTPISGGRPRVSYDESVFEGFVGFGMFAPAGELAGAAVVDGNRADISFVTTKIAPGDLPLLTVALRARRDAMIGSRTSFSLDPASIWTLNGEDLQTRIQPATVTVGGTLSISSVVPGQGWFPAGTVVSVRGIGFDAGTRLRLEDTAITRVRVVSPTEMQFTLVDETDMTGKRLRADKRDGSRVYYYVYTRGVAAAVSTRPLLARTVPIFSGTLRSVANFGVLPAAAVGQYAAMALLNPGLTSATVTVSAYSGARTLIGRSTFALGEGQRLALDLSELLGFAPPAGSWIQVTASQPIASSQLMCDELAWKVTPALAIAGR